MFKKFWQEVGKKVWVADYKDPMMSRTTFRRPAPASQPEYKKPVTAASALYGNEYFKRDTRRNYPKAAVYTQADVGQLLLGTTSAEGKAVAAAVEGGEAAVPSVEVKDIVEAIAKLDGPVYSESNLPPVPGVPYKYRVSPEQVIEGPGEYYPSYRVF